MCNVSEHAAGAVLREGEPDHAAPGPKLQYLGSGKVPRIRVLCSEFCAEQKIGQQGRRFPHNKPDPSEPLREHTVLPCLVKLLLVSLLPHLQLLAAEAKRTL